MNDTELQAWAIGITTESPMLNIITKLYHMGYDRYSVEGHTQGSVCRLWKRGEEECSVTVSAPGPEMAVYWSYHAAMMAP